MILKDSHTSFIITNDILYFFLQDLYALMELKHIKAVNT